MARKQLESHLDIELSPGANPGELDVTYTVDARNNEGFSHQIGAIDLALAAETDWPLDTAPPVCRQAYGAMSLFDHEIGTTSPAPNTRGLPRSCCPSRFFRPCSQRWIALTHDLYRYAGGD